MDFGESGYRDVFFQGKCDDGCLQLAQMLGWEVSGCGPCARMHAHTYKLLIQERLREMHRVDHERLEKEIEDIKSLMDQFHITAEKDKAEADPPKEEKVTSEL